MSHEAPDNEDHPSAAADLLESIAIVEDRTSESRCDEGFLRLQRLIVRNRYRSGAESEPYPCDIVRRPSADAVAVVLYRTEPRKPEDGDRRRIVVILREAPRVPIYLRRHADLVLPDPKPYTTLVELVAGLIEPSDTGARGLEERAAAEAREEAGFPVGEASVRRLGLGSFASPGISDEKVFFAAAPVEGLQRERPTGDGSVMEEGSVDVAIDLREAIRACRTGEIPDLKTEVGLQRLADALGYVPTLDRFVDELPDDSRVDRDALGAGDGP